MRHLVAAALVVACAGLVRADAKPDAKADAKATATGTWKWTVMFGDRSIEWTLNLKQDGDKLTGTMKGPRGGETAIEGGKCKDGEVCFKVTRERMGQKFTSTYKGKLSGDSIKGSMEFKRGDEDMKRDWEAKRSRD